MISWLCELTNGGLEATILSTTCRPTGSAATMVVTIPSTVMISEREQLLILDQSHPESAQRFGIDHRSTSEAKISLFRSLFRGRDDVYARRFESKKSGKSGYAPACANEWVRGICEKPRIKCADCTHRRFLDLTDEVVRRHLSGADDDGKDFVAGIYPLLRDDSCFFLAVDFDKEQWQQDAVAYFDTCSSMGLPAALERSRSGRGGHVWLFFDEAIPATLARRLGSYILTETMERRPELGFSSYDRFFPNQDTLPKAGFGNLIALPLQKKARERGNSVFLDRQLRPYPDQWSFLAALHRIRTSTVEQIVEGAERRGRIVGVRLPPQEDEPQRPWRIPKDSKTLLRAEQLPREIELVLSNDIYISKEELPPALRNQLLRIAAFQNPEFYRAQSMRLPTWNKPRVIGCAEDHPHHISLPRGCLEDVLTTLSDLGIHTSLRDERSSGNPIDVTFRGELNPEQKKAGDALLGHDTGVLAATTAFGKTVLGAWLIAKRGTNTLVLVHRRQLLDQWMERLSTFLGISPAEIGQIGGGRNKPTGWIDIALIQSLRRKGLVDDRITEYGHLIIDECHHLPAWSFEQVARHSRARFVTGLSATVARKDGHHPIITMQCGPVRHRVSAKSAARRRPFQHTVLVRPTSFHPGRSAGEGARAEFQMLYRDLLEDEHRNRQICEDVVEAVRSGRSPLVLTERNEHLDRLASTLDGKIQHVIVLRGGMSRRSRAEVAERLRSIPDSDERVLLSTGKYIGEGFDDPRLDTLMITLPVSWKGTIAQYVGRLHRLYEGKRVVQVYDYVDLDVPMLARMFERRCKGYESVGYTLTVPASATPGWPAEVPLPPDPEWKHDYTATVRRLIRDGVDLPLARLFVDAVRPLPHDAVGLARARSSSESFLFRRLETLEETRGRFKLNAALSIPFDGAGRMEVDLLCADANVVIEIDGPQHLADVAAYRRDRRKDLLLQESGYFVLRFLAEDLGTDLDSVLDTVLRALAHRARLR
jgi:superfamily II DNA or RNA helicase/very-short-patch-repair endonuclease